MIQLTFKATDGSMNCTEATNLFSASQLIESYAKLNYTIVAIHDNRASDTFYTVLTSEDNYYTVLPSDNTEDSINRWFAKLAKTIAFIDCSAEIVTSIVHKGQEITYAGWKPGMRYEFIDAEGNIVWSASFPEWDH